MGYLFSFGSAGWPAVSSLGINGLGEVRRTGHYYLYYTTFGEFFNDCFLGEDMVILWEIMKGETGYESEDY